MPPVLEFSDKGIKFTVFSSSSGTQWSCMKCTVQKFRAFTCIIVPRGFISLPSTGNRPPELHLEEPMGPNLFAIYANDKDMTLRFLDNDVREALQQFGSWGKMEFKNGFFGIFVRF